MESVTVVYIDMLFLLNLIANYLLLLGAGRMAGAVLRRSRIGLSAAFGALYAVVVCLPNMEWLSGWPYKFLSGILMTLIAYGRERGLLRVGAMFFGASMGLAGLIMAMELLGGTTFTLHNGTYYSRFDIRLLLVLFLVCYAAMSVFFPRIVRHEARELIPLEIHIQGEIIRITALLDTGHTLTDPIRNLPVIVAEANYFSHILPPNLDFQSPVECLKNCKSMGVKGITLIPYKAIGVECGMLLAIKSSSVIANGSDIGGLMVALSPTVVSDGGGYHALIGGII